MKVNVEQHLIALKAKESLPREKGSYAFLMVGKALELLDILAEEPADATLPSLSEKLGVSRNKTFLLLATLGTRGLAERAKILSMKFGYARV